VNKVIGEYNKGCPSSDTSSEPSAAKTLPKSQEQTASPQSKPSSASPDDLSARPSRAKEKAAEIRDEKNKTISQRDKEIEEEKKGVARQIEQVAKDTGEVKATIPPEPSNFPVTYPPLPSGALTDFRDPAYSGNHYILQHMHLSQDCVSDANGLRCKAYVRDFRVRSYYPQVQGKCFNIRPLNLIPHDSNVPVDTLCFD
jgi:hypothetical protein